MHHHQVSTTHPRVNFLTFVLLLPISHWRVKNACVYLRVADVYIHTLLSIITHAQGFAAPPRTMQQPIKMRGQRSFSDTNLWRSYWKTGSSLTEPVLVQELQQWPLSPFIVCCQVSVIMIQIPLYCIASECNYSVLECTVFIWTVICIA